MLRRTTILLLTPTLLAGCAAREAVPEGPVLLGVEVAPPEPEPPPPPMTLEERWAAPFAVEHQGTLPARSPQRLAVVRPAKEAPKTVVVAPAESPPAPAEGSTAAAKPTTPQPAASRPEAAKPAAPSARAASRVHTVAPGETFFGIARQYRLTFDAMRAANPDVDPKLVKAGQKLQVPDGSVTFTPKAKLHKVAEGETLWAIARRYGVAPERIREANRLTDDRVRLGQTLVIPGVE